MNIFLIQLLIGSGRGGGGSLLYDFETKQGEMLYGMFVFFLPWILSIVVSVYLYCRWREIKIKYFFRYFSPLSLEHKKLLSQKFKFYNKLSYAQKKIFEKRVNHFLISKNFISEGTNEVKDEMKVLIAASCTQLTLGLSPNYLSHFKSIKVFEDAVDWKKIIKSKGQVAIPWHEFMLGYNVPDDGYNPGLEIMAMAISIEDRIGRKAGYIFGENEYLRWNRISRIHAESLIRMGVTKYKNYNELDKDEYFAVTVVFFFEQPANFKARFPELYDCMARLLKQNPLKYK